MSSQYEMSDDLPVYVISVAAELSGMHPQTLRAYDRLGLVSPGRSAGRGRRYSMRDILALREIQRLSQDEGVNLAGVKLILDQHPGAGAGAQAGRRAARRGRAAPHGAGVHPGRGGPAGRAAPGRGRHPVGARARARRAGRGVGTGTGPAPNG